MSDAALLGAFTVIDDAYSDARANGWSVDGVMVPGIGPVLARDVSRVWGWLVDIVKSRHTAEWEAVNDAQYEDIRQRAAQMQGTTPDRVDWDAVPDEVFDGKPSALDNAVTVLTLHVAG